MADALCLIGFVSSQTPPTPAFATCPPSEMSAACECLKLCRFVSLAGKKQDTEWDARAVTQQMQLGRETTFGTP
jgi:hypothetical protein